MNKVTVEKDALAAAIHENRAKHRTIFLEAVEGYRAEQVRVMEADIKRLKSGKVLNGVRYLPVPQDHTRDYDRVLKMLSMHAESTIDISQEDFAKYVMDDWQWRREFLNTSANYSAGAAAALAADGDEEAL